MRKRIALDALMLDETKAGVGNYQFNLINNLKNMPFDFDVYTCADLEGADNINIIKTKSFSSSKERLMFQLFGFSELLNKKSYSLVHFLDYMTPLKRLKSPHVTTVHDISFKLFPQYFTKGAAAFKSFNLPRALNKSQGIITVSEFTKSEILKVYPKTDGNKIKAIPLGINPPPEGEFPVPAEASEPYVLFVGTVEPRKNILMLIKAMERVWDRGINENLIIAGKFGWLYEETVKYAENSRYRNKIMFTGYISDDELEGLYRHASLFAFPSLYEGFGLPPLEAMSRRLPVISTSSASLPEALGDAAMFADGEDGFADAISKALTDSRLKACLSAKSLSHASTKTWLKTAEKTCRFYEERLV